MMKKYLRKIGIVLVLFMFSTAAFAGNVVDFWFSYTIVGQPGGADHVYGDLYATMTVPGVYLVTDANGRYLGPAPNGILFDGVFDASQSGNIFAFDNLLYYPASPQYLSSGGIVFDVNNDHNIANGTNLYWENGEYWNLTWTADGGYNQQLVRDLSIMPRTPEPNTLLTLGSGILGLAGLARKRFLS